MIALAVFGIGIVGILWLITHHLATIQRAHLETTSAILAREGMEMLYQIRNTNYLTYSQRDCLQYKKNTDVCEVSLGDLARNGSHLHLTRTPSHIAYETVAHTPTNGFTTNRSNNRLHHYLNATYDYQYYAHSWLIAHDIKGDPSPFARSLQFTGVQHLPDANLLSGSIYKVQINVSYIQGAQTGKVLLESFIGNTQKTQTGQVLLENFIGSVQQ